MNLSVKCWVLLFLNYRCYLIRSKLMIWCFWTVVLEKTLESPLDCIEIQPVHPKEISPGCSLEGLKFLPIVEAEAPILWRPDAKSWLIWKDPNAGKDWGEEEKGTTEGEMVGWHHQLNGHGFGWTLGVGDGQGGLVCCSSWDHKESDMTEWLNWTETEVFQQYFIHTQYLYDCLIIPSTQNCSEFLISFFLILIWILKDIVH